MTNAHDDAPERGVLLPEEQAAGSDAPMTQAEIILAESEARTENEAVGIRADNVAEGSGLDEADPSNRDRA